MLRIVFAALVLVATAPARAADLPAGVWTANLRGSKGDLTVSEVKDGTLKMKFGDTEISARWDGKVLTFHHQFAVYEGCLLSEPGENGKTKYTLTGLAKESKFPEAPNRAGDLAPPAKILGGWLATLTVAPGEIKAEVRGILVYESYGKAYVDVKRKGETADMRIWVYAADHEWQKFKESLPKLNGKEVIVTATLAKLNGKDHYIPEGALIFLGKFEPKLANPPK